MATFISKVTGVLKAAVGAVTGVQNLVFPGKMTDVLWTSGEVTSGEGGDIIDFPDTPTFHIDFLSQENAWIPQVGTSYNGNLLLNANTSELRAGPYSRDYLEITSNLYQGVLFGYQQNSEYYENGCVMSFSFVKRNSNSKIEWQINTTTGFKLKIEALFGSETVMLFTLRDNEHQICSGSFSCNIDQLVTLTFFFKPKRIYFYVDKNYTSVIHDKWSAGFIVYIEHKAIAVGLYDFRIYKDVSNEVIGNAEQRELWATAIYDAVRSAEVGW